MNKINITKSRSGHYTLTVRNQSGERIFIRGKLQLFQARQLAQQLKTQDTTAHTQ